MNIWEPHTPRGLRCVAETCCRCEAYILCFEGAEYYVLRRNKDGKELETARGSYTHAAKAWSDLVEQHCREERAAS